MFRVAMLLGCLLFASCVSPVRSRVLILPKRVSCSAKTYVLNQGAITIASPDPGQAERIQKLESIFEKKMSHLGLLRVPQGQTADYVMTYSYTYTNMPATASPEGVTMASDYPLGTIDLTMAAYASPPFKIYHSIIQGLVGDIASVNFDRLSGALDKAFSGWPRCTR